MLLLFLLRLAALRYMFFHDSCGTAAPGGVFAIFGKLTTRSVLHNFRNEG